MSHPDDNADRLLDLAGAICNKTASQTDLLELDSLLRANPSAQNDYLEYCWIHAAVRLQLRAQCAAQRAHRKILAESDIAASDHPPSVGAQAMSAGVSALPSIAIHGPAGFFSSGWPVAYLIASVIFAVGLLVGAIVHVSQPASIVLPSHPGRGAGGEGGRDSLPSSIVARITGMVDCVVNDAECRMLNAELKTDIHPSSFILHHSPLHLGDRLALRSGLLEITYDTGAKVILQGPVTYEVESPASGYLSIGRLTAKLEKRSAVSGQRSVAGKSEIPSPQSLAPSPSSNPQSLTPNPLFSVRTPTAVVTDLGTEFGVEVDASGATRSHVFRGSVRVQRRSADGTETDAGRVLCENQSVRIAADGIGAIATATVGKVSAFVRGLPKETIRIFDLVDVVAGGDGFSGKRNRGIDPTTGRHTDVPPRTPKNAKEYFVGDARYHRTDASPMIDGVFIPGSRPGPVQVDSVGHACEEFPATSNQTSTYVWAGGRIPTDAPLVVRTELAGVDYASAGHGLLFMEANKGITFDLAAIRRANPGCKLLRFRSTAGNTETGYDEGGMGSADLWVLVDGQVRLKRREINSFSGIVPVVIPLDDRDRFLTLVTTDGGNGITWDWIIFGDPHIEMRQAEIASPGERRVERPVK